MCPLRPIWPPTSCICAWCSRACMPSYVIASITSAMHSASCVPVNSTCIPSRVIIKHGLHIKQHGLHSMQTCCTAWCCLGDLPPVYQLSSHRAAEPFRERAAASFTPDHSDRKTLVGKEPRPKPQNSLFEASTSLALVLASNPRSYPYACAIGGKCQW
jgi:hypothetical protein